MQIEETSGSNPHRAAWIEIDQERLRANYRTIAEALPAQTGFAAVVKDEAYGHGATLVAHEAASAGAKLLAVVNVEEALALRKADLGLPILVLGERQPDELPACVEHGLSICVHREEDVRHLAAEAARQGRKASVHVKINTGMNRYGVRWHDAATVISRAAGTQSLHLEGVMSHFSMSDELDKSFAYLQLSRFRTVLQWMESQNIHAQYRHLCNSGGFLDLPDAHYDIVRIGLLALGVYPSNVCRRLPGIRPVMAVKTRISLLQDLHAGDKVGYGMRFTATDHRRIAVLPVGYGDGFPRVRNTGRVLIGGEFAPLVGGVSMDAVTVDVTHIPHAKQWDEVVLMGQQGAHEITVNELASLRQSVSYDQLCSWRGRLPRITTNPPSES